MPEKKLSNNSEPLVSVVTPVYNTEKYLSECIESVLHQTYANWEYIIVNNCSIDSSGDIALEYANQDSRIKVYNNEVFLDQMQNWNRAMQLISSDSKYCKVVHADDWLFPECISRMVELSEQYPSAGIVGAYRLDENLVNLDGLPYPSDLVAGKTIGRLYYLEGLYLFGSPTSVLIRSDFIKSTEAFYEETNIHADLEVCLKILKKADFGFVHQVLTFTRRHNETNTTFIRKYRTYKLGVLHALKHHGSYYLSDKEYASVLKKLIKTYYKDLAKKVLTFDNTELISYHRENLLKIGINFSQRKLLLALLKVILNKTLRRLKIV